MGNSGQLHTFDQTGHELDKYLRAGMRRKLAMLIRLEFKMLWSVQEFDFKRVSANREYLTNSEQVDLTFFAHLPIVFSYLFIVIMKISLCNKAMRTAKWRKTEYKNGEIIIWDYKIYFRIVLVLSLRYFTVIVHDNYPCVIMTALQKSLEKAAYCGACLS